MHELKNVIRFRFSLGVYNWRLLRGNSVQRIFDVDVLQRAVVFHWCPLVEDFVINEHHLTSTIRKCGIDGEYVVIFSRSRQRGSEGSQYTVEGVLIRVGMQLVTGCPLQASRCSTWSKRSGSSGRGGEGRGDQHQRDGALLFYLQ